MKQDMKNSLFRLAATLILSVLVLTTALFISCATAPKEDAIAETEPTAPSAAATWSIALAGVREDVLDGERFNEAKTHSSHYVKMDLERKGQTNVYRGMPLYLITAMVDGSDSARAM